MKRKNVNIILFCLGLSFLFLTICSKTSFLYPFHDWFDSNAFLTMGRGMKHGLIPYRDLFEQKGPILYFLHMISSIISENSFIGTFFLQIISFTIFLYYTHKVISLYLPKKTCYYLLPLFTFLIFMMKSYRYGDSAEEFCLPLLMISLYDLLLYTKGKQIEIPTKMFFKNGLIAGIVLWIKYTLLGFWFGFMAFFFFYLITKKEYKKAILSSFTFLGGMTIITIPILIYFGSFGSIDDLFDCYFFVNIQNYTVSSNLGERTIWIFKTLFSKFTQEYMVGILILIGSWLFKKSKQKTVNIAILTTIFFLILTVYGGGRAYSYYFLIFAPFCLFGLIFLYQTFLLQKKVSMVYSGFLILITFFIALNFQHNTVDLGKNKKDYAQYQFANIIKQRKPNSSILNYGFLDGGFYLTTNTLPHLKYFQKNNIPYQTYPINLEAQKKAITKKEVDYVILFIKKGQTMNDVIFPALINNYQFVTRHTQKIEGKMQSYYLFEKK